MGPSAPQCTSRRAFEKWLEPPLRRSSRRRSVPIFHSMPQPNLACPICDADLVLAGDESPGDEVFCSYCGAPVLLKPSADDPEEMEAEDAM
jgi:DNA-directed RNA polymerase subunit RPC12/RpoP